MLTRRPTPKDQKIGLAVLILGQVTSLSFRRTIPNGLILQLILWSLYLLQFFNVLGVFSLHSGLWLVINVEPSDLGHEAFPDRLQQPRQSNNLLYQG